MADLQTWMSAAGENDETLSRKVGVSRVQISRLRRGRHKPSRETALKLQEITGIPAAQLIFGEAAA